MATLISLAYQPKAKFLTTLAHQGQANQAPAMLRHEVNRVWSRHLRWNNEITFVFALFIDDRNERSSAARATACLLMTDKLSLFDATLRLRSAIRQKSCNISGDHVHLKVDAITGL